MMLHTLTHFLDTRCGVWCVVQASAVWCHVVSYGVVLLCVRLLLVLAA